MTSAQEELQRIIDDHYRIYCAIVDSVVTELATLERKLLDDLMRDCTRSRSPARLHAYSQDLAFLQELVRVIEFRRRRMERLAVDGPGEWFL
jgi:hypothetical protein